MDSPESIPVRLPLRDFFARLLLLFMASYGMLYYSYKYFSPLVLNGDSTYYYPLYSAPLNFHAAQAPFVLRQVSVVLTYVVWRCHIYYPDVIALNGVPIDQHLFFAALFVNWVCLVLTAMTAGLIAEKLLGVRNMLLFTLAAFFCLLTFHAQVAVLIDTAEGPAWLLMALAFLAFLRRSKHWLLIILALAIFEREMILLAIGFLAFLELLPWKKRRPFAWFALLSSMACFFVYLALRRHYAGGYEFQSHPGSLLHGLFHMVIGKDLLFQGLLVQNIIFIALGAYWLAKRKPAAVRYWMPKLLATFVFLALVALAASEDTTTGRLAGILTPMFAAFAALALGAMQGEVPTADTSVPALGNREAILFLVGASLLLPVVKVYSILHPKHHHRLVEAPLK